MGLLKKCPADCMNGYVHGKDDLKECEECRGLGKVMDIEWDDEERPTKVLLALINDMMGHDSLDSMVMRKCRELEIAIEEMWTDEMLKQEEIKQDKYRH